MAPEARDDRFEVVNDCLGRSLTETLLDRRPLLKDRILVPSSSVFRHSYRRRSRSFHRQRNHPAGAIAERIVKREREKKKKRTARQYGHDGQVALGFGDMTDTDARETDNRQTGRRTAGRRTRQTDRQTGRQIDKQIDREIGIVNNGRFSVIRCCLFKTNFSFVLRGSSVSIHSTLHPDSSLYPSFVRSVDYRRTSSTHRYSDRNDSQRIANDNK